jgi:hypothetical protein
MTSELPIGVGDTATVAMLSLCAGGLVRTWTDPGGSRLWSVSEPAALQSVLGTGTLSRTVREQGRYREVGLLSEDSGTLLLTTRFPDRTEGDDIRLGADVVRLEPAREPTDGWYDDVRTLLGRAVGHAVETGGWDAPPEPYCLFILVPEEDRVVSVIETAPQPAGSEIWAPHLITGQAGATMTAPATRETIDAAPIIMIEAMASWGLAPWDLALTFGTR